MTSKKRRSRGKFSPARGCGFMGRNPTEMLEGCEFCGAWLRDDGGVEAVGWESVMVPVRSPRGVIFYQVRACPGCQSEWGVAEEAKLARMMGLSAEGLRARVGVPADRVTTLTEVAGHRESTYRGGKGRERRRRSLRGEGARNEQGGEAAAGSPDATMWEKIGRIARAPDLATLARMTVAFGEEAGLGEAASLVLADVVDSLLKLRVLARAEGNVSEEAVVAATVLELREAGLRP